MSSFATIRQTVAQMVSDTTWATYSYPPPTPQANSVVVSWDDPAVVSTNNKKSLQCMARFKISIFVPLVDNQGNLDRIEDMANKVRMKLNDDTMNIGDMSAPSVIQLANADLLTCEFSVETLTTWSAA